MAVVESLRALRLLLPQNQLKDGSMAEIEVGQTSPADTTIARGHGLGGAFSLLGMMLAGALVLVLLTNSLAEPMVVGLLGLLAVAGVFLVFGLLSGFLRLGERAAEADMIRAVAEGLDSALQDRQRARQRTLSQSGSCSVLPADAPAAMPAWKNCLPVSPIRHRPSSGSAARPSACEGREEEIYVHPRPLGGGAPAVGSVSLCGPFRMPRAGRWRPPADALAGRRRDARAHARNRDSQRARSRRWPSTTGCRRACWRCCRTGGSRISMPRWRNG